MSSVYHCWPLLMIVLLVLQCHQYPIITATDAFVVEPLFVHALSSSSTQPPAPQSFQQLLYPTGFSRLRSSSSASSSSSSSLDLEQQSTTDNGNSPNKKRKGGGGTKKYKIRRQQGSNNKNKKRYSKKQQQLQQQQQQQQQEKTKRNRDPLAVETWRVFGVEVHPDDYCIPSHNYGILQTHSNDDKEESRGNPSPPPPEKLYLTEPVIQALMDRLGIPTSQRKIAANNESSSSSSSMIQDIRVVRRSLDARKKKRNNNRGGGGGEKTTGSSGPQYVFVLDFDLQGRYANELKLKQQSGRLELLPPPSPSKKEEEGKDSVLLKDDNNNNLDDAATIKDGNERNNDGNKQKKKKKVIIVGAGPAGLFCALTLARSGLDIQPIVVERGLPVESRGKSIGALIHRKTMDKESNFAFGEGGAGTWSDGKLTTRIGRNSHAVRDVLQTLVDYGAPSTILVHGSPHLGTDNLVKLLRSMRLDLRKLGGEIIFGAKMTDLIMDKTNQQEGETTTIRGIKISKTPAIERRIENPEENVSLYDFEGETTIMGDAVVLATGHSARDVYEKLHAEGVQLEAKGFAVGFRVEHPQKIINKIQYGTDWGMSVVTGKTSTDQANEDYFNESQHQQQQQQPNRRRRHEGRLPVPSYRLATDAANDGSGGGRNRGVYSFCMCPGGQIVPASTDPNEVCVNGMSFSRRDSSFANSALVVTVSPDDDVLKEYKTKFGVLAGLAFQRDMERTASEFGGGDLTVPVQRLTDFVAGKASTTAPPSSYRLGVKPAACHEIYPKPLWTAMTDAVCNHFEKQMPGFLCDDALLHGVETRTSSPVRVSRDPETMEAPGTNNLFPAGEGAGFAGGIVSAAVDGMAVANSILQKVAGDEAPTTTSKTSKKLKSVGFNY